MKRSILFGGLFVLLAACGGGEEAEVSEQAMLSDSETTEAEQQNEEDSNQVNTETLTFEGGDAFQGYGETGAPIPNLSPLFYNVDYVDQPVAGKYQGKAFILLDRDSEESYAIKMVDLEGMNVEKTIYVCCHRKGQKRAIQKVVASPQGDFYALGLQPSNVVYRSQDEGESWQVLGPDGDDDRSRNLRFQEISELEHWGELRDNDIGPYSHVTDIKLVGDGDLLIETRWDGSRIGVIDRDSGEGSLRDWTWDERYNMPNMNALHGAENGDIYVVGRIDEEIDGNFPTLVWKSTDNGESFTDISEKGKKSFSGVSWNGDLLMRNPDVAGAYVLNGQTAGSEIGRGSLVGLLPFDFKG